MFSYVDEVIAVSTTKPDFYPSYFERTNKEHPTDVVEQGIFRTKLAGHIQAVLSAQGAKDVIEIIWSAYATYQNAAGFAHPGIPKVFLCPSLLWTLPPEHAVTVYTGIGIHELTHVYESDAATNKVLAHRSSRVQLYYNLIEDERIEAIARKQCPTFSYYLWIVKDQILKGVHGEFEKAIKDNAPLETCLDTFMFNYLRTPHTLSDEQKTWEPIPGHVVWNDLAHILKTPPSEMSSKTYPLNKSVELAAYVDMLLEKAKPPKSEEAGSSADADESSDSPEASGESGDGSGDSPEGARVSEDATSASTCTPEDTEATPGKDDHSSERPVHNRDRTLASGAEAAAKAQAHDELRTLAHAAKGDVRSDRATAPTAGEKCAKTVKGKLVDSTERPPEVLKPLADLKSIGVEELPEALSAKEAETLVSITSTDLELMEASDPYSKDRRKIISRKPVPSKEGKARFKSVLRRSAGHIKAMSAAFNIRHAEQTLVQTEQTSGRLSRRLVALGSTTDKVFERQHTYITEGLCIALLIDESGSMHCSRKIEKAREVAIVLAEALKRIAAVELTVYGHTSSSAIGMSDDLACVINRYSDSGTRGLELLGEIDAHNNNYDGWAIQHVGKLLSDTPTTSKKWMIVVSDGAPCAYDYTGPEAVEHTRKQVALLESKGIRVLAVDIEGQDCTKIYKHSVKFTNHATLVQDMRKLVSRALLQGREVEV